MFQFIKEHDWWLYAIYATLRWTKREKIKIEKLIKLRQEKYKVEKVVSIHMTWTIVQTKSKKAIKQ